MANVGDTVTFAQGAKSGSAPGQQQWDLSGSQAKVIGTRVVNGQTYYNIDQRATGGGTGWVLGSMIGGGQQPAAQPAGQPATAAPAGNVSSMLSSAAQKPTLDLNALYEKEITNNPLIQEANTAIAAAQGEIQKRRQALAEAEAQINDNPFYSEATRVGKIAKLQEKAQADIANFERELALKQDSLAKLRGDAETKIGLATKQYDINRTEYQDNLQKFNMLLQSGAIRNASGSDIAQISAMTGISSDMIGGIINKMKQDEVKPQVITSTDENGNLTYAVIDQMTGNLISKNTLGGVGKTSGGAKNDKEEARFDAAIEKGIQLLQSGESWGNVWNRIKSMFPDVPNELIDVGLGVTWSKPGAYEDFAKKKAMASL